MENKFFNVVPGDGEASVLLYGDIGNGEKVESGRVVSELLALQKQYKRIDVRINSRGGDVFSGIAIYNALRASTADITIYVDGLAASIAGIIALCGKPLYMSPYAKLMLHSVSAGAYGNASSLRQTASMIEMLEQDLAKMIAQRCGKTWESVKEEWFDEQDHWLSASEAVSMGLADGIYDMPDEENAPSTTEEIYQYFNNRLHHKPQTKNNMELIEKMREIGSFKDLDENGIVAKAQELDNMATKVAALEAANAAYKKQLEEAEQKEMEAVVDKAVADGKIGAEQKDTWVKLMASDRANTEALLEGMKPAQPARRAMNDINEGAGVAGLASKSWDELDKAGALGTLKNQDKAAFAAKFKEKFGVDYKE